MTDVDSIVTSLLADTQLSNEPACKPFREDKGSKSKTDSLVDRILAKNAAKNPSLAISILKSHGLDAVHAWGQKYEIVQHHEWYHQAQDAAVKTKRYLLDKCPELHVKNVSASADHGYFSGKNRSIVMFEVC